MGRNLSVQFQILIYVPLKFSEVSGPPILKSCVRYCSGTVALGGEWKPFYSGAEPCVSVQAGVGMYSHKPR